MSTELRFFEELDGTRILQSRKLTAQSTDDYGNGMDWEWSEWTKVPLVREKKLELHRVDSHPDEMVPVSEIDSFSETRAGNTLHNPGADVTNDPYEKDDDKDAFDSELITAANPFGRLDLDPGYQK